MTLKLTEERILTPLGQAIALTDNDGNLRAFEWSDCETRLHRLLRRQYGRDIEIVQGFRLSKASLSIGAYFEGALNAIDGIEVATNGTSFQKKVWTALRKIPSGKTRSYAEIARKIGAPGAARAVGAANGANPISVVIPCHRMIAADGKLTGYAGGLHRKEWLLMHEGALRTD